MTKKKEKQTRKPARNTDYEDNYKPNTEQDKRISISPVAINEEQKEALRSFAKNDITILTGPPGTGKTFLTTAFALNEFLHEKYQKLVFTRPAVESFGEELGFLPGDFNQKIAPYMMPIFDKLGEKLSKEHISKYILDEIFRTIPFAFMRGIEFKESFVIVDEAQNTKPEQMRLALTRLGKNSKMVIDGDLNQSDIKGKNGLQDAIERLKGMDGVGIVHLSEQSIVRHRLIAEIERRYSLKTKNENEKLTISEILGDQV